MSSEWSYGQTGEWPDTCYTNGQTPINIDTSIIKKCSGLCKLKMIYKPSKCTIEFKKHQNQKHFWIAFWRLTPLANRALWLALPLRSVISFLNGRNRRPHLLTSLGFFVGYRHLGLCTVHCTADFQHDALTAVREDHALAGATLPNFLP